MNIRCTATITSMKVECAANRIWPPICREGKELENNEGREQESDRINVCISGEYLGPINAIRQEADHRGGFSR